MGVLANFDAEAAWVETHVCDDVLQAWLRPIGGDWGRSSAAPAAVRGAAVHWVLAGTLLVYLAHGDGHVGVLCEAGEWLAIPAGMRHAFEASDTDALDLAIVDDDASDPADTRRDERAALHPDLPAFEDFVDVVLAMTGHAADD